MEKENIRYQQGKKISIISILSNVLLAVLKISIGFFANSKALIADGFHSVSDMASTIIVMASMKFSETPADKNHPYGHEKAEALGTNILAVILVLTAFFLGRDAVLTIVSGNIAEPGSWALFAAFVSIIVKEILYRFTIKIGEEINSRGLIADAHHHRSDALSSIAALIGIGGAKLGFRFLDPLAGLVVALLILKVGYEIMRDTSYELMDGRPDKEKINEIRDLAAEIEGVIEIHDIKLRSYGPNYIVDLKIVVEDQLSVADGHNIACLVEKKIIKNSDDVKDVMVHVDPLSAHQN
ncbi:MAG: cation diffusion facilitator family transporter [Halanaerobium sp. 4-GBenrich]|jgi:cation diffusion facilitator family transporter|uniref:Cation diffusion facilitator family transporter n=1 Tax=Halanaerobium congolense TaxID=54121 RepID=A0A1G6JQL4_9FIRM|nr:cation diffusion facilitator family transporter [Halanaerobium congolense]ODS50600.1 MAG: cation diffusion facilitator family transporter [Halanaerobium sp. 4-GBenrich]PXV65153.1 cation diffusion facilitator family transporter [Halanaerobium congolense]TDS31076.1 cation diffusion facilitator family transporter [Halanaerobium congolense]SDC21019.1 cation diffusion facilitator family transporter [Halanaerobium congolense]SDK42876.1 cation diffusion facilitator family transporter [Halanaerobiu